jgi:hypothetical protein
MARKISASAVTLIVASVLSFGVTSSLQAQKYEITDPTFDERSKEERAEEEWQSMPAPAPIAKPSKKKKAAKRHH